MNRNAGCSVSDFTIDKEPYIYRASRRGIKGSLDQFDVQLDVIRDYYYNKPDNYECLHFSETPSVLNVLLHFCKDKLILDDGEIFCRYREIDKWHQVTTRLGEDLFTTSYLAAFDLEHSIKSRNKFRWKPYLYVETNDINQIFSRSISDVHAHLKGSSVNFDLSWLSLMNFPCHREKDFLHLFGEKTFSVETKKGRDLVELYQYVSLAASIRLYLFELIIGEDSEETEELIVKMAKDTLVNDFTIKLSQISAAVWDYRNKYGSKLEIPGYVGKCPDYAMDDNTGDLISILSGERRILYNAFRRALGGDENVALYLYAYIVFKQQLREKIIQLNDVVGFANFNMYEKRKSCFIQDGSLYEKLLIPMAFRFFLGEENRNRYMEGRVAPKKSVTENSRIIRKMDRNVQSWDCFYGKEQFNGYYIFHFIKTSDDKSLELAPRHCNLRNTVKRQAIALYEYRRKGYKSASRVVGIDAANSEIKCRPEVFAQAFRFLRRHYIEEGVENHPSSLGFTYHVGEDFYDIVDGLRAVDEVLTYMNFRSNDRLGHALVLGTDVKKYYDGRDKAIRATRQVVLDNFVWLYSRVTRISGHIALCTYLEQEAKHLYDLIYSNAGCDIPFDINDYYDSWLLRGDAPETAGRQEKPITSISDWGKVALNDTENDVNCARKNRKACDIYYEYHFNRKVKEAGSKATVLTIPHNYYDEFVQMTDRVREVLLGKVERLHIAIECNPSSNLRIGEMTSYIEHPIFKFYNYGLKTPYPPHEISVSINTDDSGVFSTSLEREYALLGIALEKCEDPEFKNSPRAIREWLDRVRKMSVEQRFCKIDNRYEQHTIGIKSQEFDKIS